MRIANACLALAVSVGIIFIFALEARADETSELILKLLMKKGIVTQEDIDELRAEDEKAKEEKMAETPPKGLEERVEKLEKSLPKWVRAMKVKGDLRLRHEDIYNEGSNTHRERLRLRVGASTELNEKLKAAFGLATGSSDAPTSTNQTLEQEFQSKQLWLDYAYAEYAPFDWATLLGGKFKSPFYHTDMLWDADIRFDGFAGKLKYTLFEEDSDFPKTDFYIIGGYFPIDEIVGSSEPNLFIVQGAEETKFDDVAKLEAAVTMYYFARVKGYMASAETRGTNTMTGGGFAHDFHVVSPYAKLTFIDPLGVGVPLAFIGEYANNTSAGDDDNAWRAGVQFGKSPKNKDEWSLLGQYSRVEADAFFDSFPDAEFNSGGTNAKGWEVIFGYALWSNVILGADYYYTESINGPEATEHRLQSEVIFQF